MAIAKRLNDNFHTIRKRMIYTETLPIVDHEVTAVVGCEILVELAAGGVGDIAGVV